MTAATLPSQPLTRIAIKTVALAGNPNSGKTTLFNALTGLKQKVANYPGVTVEKKTGRCTLFDESTADGRSVDVIDLPGTYSLISRSPDEVVAMQVLRGLRTDTPAPDVVIAVVDASNLQRNLYLVSQLIELGRPLVIALNMVDVAKRRGIHVSPERLQAELGVPVVAVVASRGEGVDQLKRAIHEAKVAPMPVFDLPIPMREEITQLATQFKGASRRGHFSDHVVAERLLTHDEGADLQDLRNDAALRPAIDSAHARLTQLGIDPVQADIEAHYRWIDDVAAKSLDPACEAISRTVGFQPTASENARGQDAHTTTLEYARTPNLTDRLDRIFLHRIWGLFVFAGIMGTLFIAIFYLADPLMRGTEALIGWLGGLITGVLPAGPIHDLWSDGIVAGVGGVLVFVPQIALLFLFLAILEDSGYLARAAFLMDRVFGKMGLSGKSFIPLLSSFACAIPGIMATRTIENRRDRLATIFVAPFMSCSARLPVYALLIGAFFSSYSAALQGGLLFACYALGVFAAVVTAYVFKKSFLKGGTSAFIMELPTYKLPQASQVARVVVTSTWAFIRRAGTIIFALSVVLWAMTYYPRLGEARETAVRDGAKERAVYHLVSLPMPGSPDSDARNAAAHRAYEAEIDQAVAAEQLRQSFAGRFGHLIEPAIRPLGYDWKMGVGLVGAFAAREVFVSTMGIVYSAGDSEDDTAPLEQAMQTDRYPDGRPVWSIAVALSLLTWFVLAMQCISTVAIVKRETGGWRWPIFQLVYMTVLAYVCSFVVYQIALHTIG